MLKDVPGTYGLIKYRADLIPAPKVKKIPRKEFIRIIHDAPKELQADLIVRLIGGLL